MVAPSASDSWPGGTSDDDDDHDDDGTKSDGDPLTLRQVLGSLLPWSRITGQGASHLCVLRTDLHCRRPTGRPAHSIGQSVSLLSDCQTDLSVKVSHQSARGGGDVASSSRLHDEPWLLHCHKGQGPLGPRSQTGSERFGALGSCSAILASMAGLGWFCVLQSQCRVGCKWLFASNSWPADASITPSPQRLLADLLSWPSPCAPYEHSATYSQSKFRFFASTGSSPAAPAVNAQAPKLGWLASGFLRLTGPRISTPALTPTASTGTGTVGQTLAAPSDSQQRLWRPATDCLSCPWICWFGVRGRGTPRLDPASQHGVLRLPTYTHGHIRNQSQIKPRARDEPTNACTTGGAGFAVPSNRYRVRTLYDEQTGRMKPRERITHAAICLIAVPPLSQTAEAGPVSQRPPAPTCWRRSRGVSTASHPNIHRHLPGRPCQAFTNLPPTPSNAYGDVLV